MAASGKAADSGHVTSAFTAVDNRLDAAEGATTAVAARVTTLEAAPAGSGVEVDGFDFTTLLNPTP